MLRLLGWGKNEEEQRDELLSAYLDRELGERERERLEARLSEDPALQAELRAMQQTVSMVRELRQVSAPRNFILSDSMVQRRAPAPAPEPRRAWVAPVLTAATTVVSLLFVVVLVGDLLLSQVGGFASAPAPMRQAEEAAPMALEVTDTNEGEGGLATAPTESPATSEKIPRGESDAATEEEAGAAEAAGADEAPQEVEATHPPAASPEAPREELEMEVEEELSAAEATRAAEAPPGAGATPPPAAGGGPTEEARALAAPTVAPTASERSILTPTIPPEEPVVSEEELGLLEPTASELEVTPQPIRERESLVPWHLPWKTLEIALGFAALVLTFTTVLAWRARRS